MIKIKEAIIVEGRYDKNTLSQIVDAPIITTDGFGIFSNREKTALLRRLAEKRGIIVLTDSDSAGFLIRNHIKGTVTEGQVKHAYIPEIHGKERRKRASSKEGFLGVEGMRPQVIIDALRRCGATLEGEEKSPKSGDINKAFLYEIGLSGGEDSAEMRKRLARKLGLPAKMSANALLDVLNALYTRAELTVIICGLGLQE
ncbi:MAG: DUF4093 domain-containing protein [Oscillospiraceae bacterium]|nr:DUF4093 domain-containing protein [Oscillospiraceae bacterium]